ncbi:MAG: ATP-binding protein [Pseudobdellovibrionaceae bacterium]
MSLQVALLMIKVQSFIQEKNSFIPVEVELALWPGLPSIHFVGLPDQHLKESAVRIKSAIKSCGFHFPVAQQILVNLRPSYLKKTSRGLELAVAAAYLWETGQLKSPVLSSEFFIYGELSLAGEVIEPEDLGHNFHTGRLTVLTGTSLKPTTSVHFRRQVVRSLKDLEAPSEIQAASPSAELQRPWHLMESLFSTEQARLLEILAVGEHSALIAGPAGSGKSHLVQSLSAFLKAPSSEEFMELRKIHSAFGEDLRWRPVIKPHHSTPMMAMIGGGSVPFAGEISRAHGGILILDELLEFSSQVQEALREPFEEGRMRVFRSGKLKEYPAQAQILATTNLCPCGSWTPLQSDVKNCGLSAARCRSYAHRLSGPFVDRFEILIFTKGIGRLEKNGKVLYEKIKEVQNFVAGRQNVVNSRLPLESFQRGLKSRSLLQVHLETEHSQRRKAAILRVARTLADLDFNSEIRSEHLDEAILFCQTNFNRLKRWS